MIDFLIIGGGIAGLSAGARLSALGTVHVVEAEDALGYHASGRSAALFEENYGGPAVVALNRAGRAFLAHEAGGFLSPRGVLLIGTAPEKRDFDADQKTLGLDPISMDEALALMPILDANIVDRAAYHDTAKDVDTDRLLQHFVAEIRAHGGAISLKSHVTAIKATPHGWTVTTRDTTLEAGQLVNAAGPWADNIARLAGVAPIGLTPKRRSMGRIPAPTGCDVSGWPMTFGPREQWFCKPDAGALIVSPAEETPVEPHDAYADDMALAEGVARFEAMMTISVTRMLSNWGGLRTFAPDHQLVLGPDPSAPNFIWSAGQGGYGFSTAPAASQLIADLVAGRTPEIAAADVAALRPDRFR